MCINPVLSQEKPWLHQVEGVQIGVTLAPVGPYLPGKCLTGCCFQSRWWYYILSGWRRRGSPVGASRRPGEVCWSLQGAAHTHTQHTHRWSVSASSAAAAAAAADTLTLTACLLPASGIRTETYVDVQLFIFPSWWRMRSTPLPRRKTLNLNIYCNGCCCRAISSCVWSTHKLKK